MTCDHTCPRCLGEFIGSVFVAGLLVCAVVWIVFAIANTVM